MAGAGVVSVDIDISRNISLKLSCVRLGGIKVFGFPASVGCVVGSEYLFRLFSIPSIALVPTVLLSFVTVVSEETTISFVVD